MRSFFIKSILFLSLFLVVIYNIDHYFVEDKIDFRNYFFFYKKPSNSLDALIIGNSHAHCGLNSRIISAKCNLNTYNLSMAGTNLNEMYSSLIEALKTQTPKLVIVENFAFLAPGQPQNILDKNGTVRVNNPNFVYAKNLSVDKFIETDSVIKGNVIYNSLNIFRNHEVWSDTENFSSVLNKYSSEEFETQFYDNALGTRIISKNRIKQYKEKVFNDSINISKDQKLILQKFIDLSKENNFKLIFVTVPFLDIYYEKTKSSYDIAYKQLEHLISEHKNVSFFDINESRTFGESYILDEKSDYLQNQHLNYKGQILASNLLANYINNNIDVDINNKNYLRDDSPEGVSYSLKRKLKDSIFLGSVNKVNSALYRQKNKTLKEIKVSKNSKYLEIEGWMKRKGLKNSEANKIVAFRKDNEFTYISIKNEVRERSAPWVEERFGPEFVNSGYRLKIEKALLEKGRYMVYHILQNKEGKCFISNTYKIITIE